MKILSQTSWFGPITNQLVFQTTAEDVKALVECLFFVSILTTTSKATGVKKKRLRTEIFSDVSVLTNICGCHVCPQI